VNRGSIAVFSKNPNNNQPQTGHHVGSNNSVPNLDLDKLVGLSPDLPKSFLQTEHRGDSTSPSHPNRPETAETALERAPITAATNEPARTETDARTSNASPNSLVATAKALGTSLGSTLCYSITSVCGQASRGAAVDIAQYPNPLLYSGLRSLVASVASYVKDRKTLHEVGIKESFTAMGREGRTMTLLMGLNNVLWVPAFMLTDLASALVIGCAQPFVHAIYDRVRTGKPHSGVELASLSLTGAALGSIALNTASAPSSYPYALWGNVAAAAATLCFCAYMIINNKVIEKAAHSAGTDPEAQAEAKKAASARLRTVPFFAQVSSTVLGLGLFIPFHSGPLLSGGLGLNPWNTLAMATIHGSITAAALYLRTAATQTNKPMVVSLISNLQVGLTPTLGYLLLGSTIPQFAIVGGILSFGASMVTIGGEYMRQKSLAAQRT
jgi:drug/metabolite transporter (DMT)-like permease